MPNSVRRVPVVGWAEPGAVRHALFGDADWQVWLDAGAAASVGRSYLGAGRTRLVTANVARGTVTERILANGLERELECTIFEYLRDDLESHVDMSSSETSDLADSTDVAFRLGWVGWFGYELGSQTVGAPVSDSDADVLDACFVFLDRAVEFDHTTGEIFALSLDSGAESENTWAEEVATAIKSVTMNVTTNAPTHAPTTGPAPADVRFRFDRTAYEKLIARCLDEIRAGNAYQLCLTNRIDIAFASTNSAPSAIDLYERLRAANPTHHGGLLSFGATSLLSSSPEVFLKVTPDGHVTTKPIKGTRPRGATDEADAQLATELSENEKERAENLMIVDLMRNDLGRIARVGTVAVEKLLDVESYANVHQLVSTVGADLATGLTAVDAIEASFPAGSMTGAPKLSAMRILNRLEAGPRGIYSGAFGYLSLDGACDLAMVIRSIVLTSARASIGTGGGITIGSIPSEEWEETLVKARPLLRVLGVTDLPA